MCPKNTFRHHVNVIRKQKFVLEAVNTFNQRPFSIKILTFLEEKFEVSGVQCFTLVKKLKDIVELTTGIPR